MLLFVWSPLLEFTIVVQKLLENMSAPVVDQPVLIWPDFTIYPSVKYRSTSMTLKQWDLLHLQNKAEAVVCIAVGFLQKGKVSWP